MMPIDPIAVANFANTVRVKVQDVKVHKRRCENLIMRCNLLIDALCEDKSNGSTLSAAHEDALNDAQDILRIVRERVERWATMDMVRSLLHQGEISESVDQLHRRVDTCIAACHVRITRELAQAQSEQTLAAQRDNSEIRDLILELRASFTQYIHNQDAPLNSEAFQTVVQDIEEETREIQSYASAHDEPEEFSDSGSFISQSDPFDRAMRKFCRSLVNLELSQPLDLILPPKPPRGKPPNLKKQPSKGSLSLRSLKSLGRRTSSMSTPQLPPLDFGEEDTVWHTSPFISVVPSSPSSDRSFVPPTSDRLSISPKSDRSSVMSDRSSIAPMSDVSSIYSGMSVSSRSSTLSGGSQHTITLRLERQRSDRSSILNTLHISGPLSPLKYALTTRESVWKTRGPNRTLTKATMEGLIHYLLQRTQDGDREQQDTVFISHPAFIVPMNILAMLIRRFDDALMCPVEVCIENQVRIMRLIRDWLKNEHVIIAEDVLAEMREFVITVNNSEFLDEVVLEVVQGIYEKASMNSTPLPLTSSFHPAKDKIPSPEQFANALAKLERERYEYILPIEYMAHAGNLPSCHPNLSSAIALNKLIGYLVRSSILDLDTIKGADGHTKRADVKRYFIRTAKACRTIRNFASLGAIMGALQSETITRLTATHDSMPSADRQTYKTLAEFISSKDNYSAYRQYLSKHKSKGCVPWHVVQLNDFSKIIRDEVDVDEQHEPPLLNFEKWTRLKRQAMSALRFRDVPFEYEQDGLGIAVEYLKMGLRSVSMKDDIEQSLRRRSDKIQRHEAPMQRAVMTRSQSGI